MRMIARVFGMLMMANGLFDFLFPNAAINFWTEGPGAQLEGVATMVREYRRLPIGLRRIISAWEFVTGALLTWLAMQPTVVVQPTAERRAA